MSQVEDQDSLSIKPSQEDIDFRQRTSSLTRGGSTQSAHYMDSSERTPRLLWIAIVFLLASAAGLYWLLQEQNQQYLQQQQVLSELSTSVHALQQKLDMTGENASSSLTALQSTIKTQDSEIRKLWDVANKRNKSWISELQSANAAHKKRISQLQTTIKQFKTKLAEINQSQRVVDERIKRIQSSMTLISKAAKDTEAQFIAVKAEIESLQLDVGSIPSAVQKKMDDIDQAIAAIDATRVKQARNITQLGEEINQLKAKITPSSQAGAGILAQ
jgi:chromosome segregation ATPase